MGTPVLPHNLGPIRRAVRSMKRNAARRGIEWRLTENDLMRLLPADCHYCGSKPQNCVGEKSCRHFSYNGIDRVDNKQGYFLDNVVPCCRICNLAKLDRSVEDFLSWASRLVAHQNLKGN